MKKPRQRKVKANPYHTTRKAASARKEAAKFKDGKGSIRKKIADYHRQLNEGKFDARRPEGA